MDAAAKEAAVARFLREYPQAGQAERDHPALAGCVDADWSQAPGCPAGIPVLFRGLLDQTAGPEALHVLGNVLMDDIFHPSAAMATALPFLIRLAALPDIAVRPDVVELLVVVAVLSQPVVANAEGWAGLFGDDRDHPEREQCRAAFAAHASELRALLDDDGLPDGLLSADDRECLLKAVEPQRDRRTVESCSPLIP
ncbi:hypothetical protein ACIRBY_33880 [Streptomyces sp. NPDC096136]|uniref:hypothetical protein n=1 Tax=Streptomyces sp. NPDC096136 TaxID=3366076 RepID=UPI00380CDCC7